MLNIIVCRSLYTELNPYQAVGVGSMCKKFMYDLKQSMTVE